MNKRAWLILIVAIIWFLFSGYWYLCKIKSACPEGFDFFSKSSANVQPDTATKPISFFWNSAKPLIKPSFDDLMNDLFDRMGPNDTLVIIGVYYNGESGVQLGYERAESMWNEVTSYVDQNRILTESYPESFKTPSKDSSFEAIRFRLIPFQDHSAESHVEAESESQQKNLLQLTIWFRDRTAYKLIPDQTAQSINQLVDTLKKVGNYRIDVVGHTDNSQTASENDELARQRAWAIKKMLWDKGLDPYKIFTASKGGTEIISPTDPGKNQRVEIFAVPLPDKH